MNASSITVRHAYHTDTQLHLLLRTCSCTHLCFVSLALTCVFPCLLSSLPMSCPLLAFPSSLLSSDENPRNVGSMNASDPNVGTGLVGAPACGDVMKLQLRIEPDGRITEAKFKTFGCGSAIASSSLATTMAQGKTVDEVMKIRNSDIAKHLSLPPVKLHCSMLAEDAIKAAVKDWQSKRVKAQQTAGQQQTTEQPQVAKHAAAQA